MANHEDDQAQGTLPVEPWTVLRGITRRRGLLVVLSALAVAAGIWVGRTFVKASFASEVVLVYAPLVNDQAGVQVPRLESRKHMVKVEPNLREVIKRQQLHMGPMALGRVCEARVQRDSNLLIIQVNWASPKIAAAIANDLADVFMVQQTEVRRAAVKRFIGDLELQQSRAQEALRAAADALKRFQQEHGILSVDEQIRAFLTDVSTLQNQLDQAKIERENLVLVRKNFDGIVRTFSKKLPRGLPTGETPAEQNQRLTHLRVSIEDDRRTRERRANLERASVEMNRTRRLADLGLIPRVEAERAAADHARAKELAVDTPQIREWGGQIRALERSFAVVDSANPGEGPLAPELVLKAFQAELDGMGIDDKVKHLASALERARAKLTSFPPVQRAFLDLQAKATKAQQELADLSAPLARARRIFTSDAPDFLIVSRATPGGAPVTRGRRLAAAGIGFGLMVLCVGLVVIRELTCGKIRSSRELAHFTELPVWSHLAAGQRADGSYSNPEQLHDAVGRLARLSRQLGSGIEGRGTRILITGPARPATRRHAVDALLAQYVLQDTRVAWISLVGEDRSSAPVLRPQHASQPSLSDYLRNEHLTSDRLLDCQEFDGLAILGSGAGAVAPHLRGSARMRELVRRASERFDVVILLGDSLLDSPDELALASECDVVLLVAQAQTTSREEVARLARLVKDRGLERCGWLLLDVDRDFVGLEPDRTW